LAAGLIQDLMGSRPTALPDRVYLGKEFGCEGKEGDGVSGKKE